MADLTIHQKSTAGGSEVLKRLRKDEEKTLEENHLLKAKLYATYSRLQVRMSR
jgi:hypothetical protein